jgi:hypothetical protein
MTGLPELLGTNADCIGAKRSSAWRTLAMSALAAGVVLVATRVLAQSAPPTTSEAPAAASQPAADDGKANKEENQQPFLRVVENKGKSIELQIATRDYIKHDGSGPRIGLVAVAHIGDKSFYRALEKLLAGYDVVLYESVKPAGSSKPGGETPEERADSTRAAMRFVGGIVESYKHEHDAYPADVDVLKQFAIEKDARLAQFLSIAMVDAWGRSLHYRVVPPADAADAQPTYALLSLGADGKAGGEGEDADLDLAGEEPPDPTLLSGDDGLQSQLAEALGLEFQLEAIDYSPAHWRCSDMAMDELNRRLEEKGLDFEMLGGTLAGSSLPAKLIKVVLGMMKMLDAVTDGAVTDMFKVVMIEMLGDPALIDVSMEQLGKGFGEVIIVDRNQVAVDDLKAIIANEPDVKSVAVFYGAGHMSSMVEQLRAQLGYEPVDGSERWLTAMKVDLTKSAISQREIAQIRMMIKQAIRQQLRGR